MKIIVLACVLSFIFGLAVGHFVWKPSAGVTGGSMQEMLSPSTMAVGAIRSIGNNKISMDGGWEVQVNGSTNIIKREQKSGAEFQAETAAYQQNLKPGSTQPAPMPYRDISISFTDLKIGMMANVDLIKPLKPGSVATSDIKRVLVTIPVNVPTP